MGAWRRWGMFHGSPWKMKNSQRKEREKKIWQEHLAIWLICTSCVFLHMLYVHVFVHPPCTLLASDSLQPIKIIL